MKYLLFCSMILLLTLGTIGNAFYRHNNYYPAIVYLTKSNASLTVAYFVASNLLWVAGYWLTVLFFGELRPNENEELWERLKYIATETLMAFAIFRDDFSSHFAFLFAILLYLKIIHWLGEERVDFLERSPIIPKLFHARILSLLILLGVIDVFFVTMACKAIQFTGPSPNIAFCFEYAILLPSVFYIMLKYVLHTAEIRRESPIEDKAIILLYGRIIFDFIRMVLYFSYLAVMFRLYLLPAFTFRQIFNTMRNFTSAVNDIISFRKAVRYMNKFCPDATKDDLATTDSVCIVCREDMVSEAKKLPCNHIFHGACLRSWFQRQQSCPTCRFKILNTAGLENYHHEELIEIRNAIRRGINHQDEIQRNSRSSSSSEKLICRNKDNSRFNATSSTDENLHLSSSSSVNSVYHSQQTLNNEHHCHSSPALLQSASKTRDNVLTNLSNEDLLAVERDTRECIENCLKYLQNMSKTLDSITILLQHYHSTVYDVNTSLGVNKNSQESVESTTHQRRSMDDDSINVEESRNVSMTSESAINQTTNTDQLRKLQ